MKQILLVLGILAFTTILAQSPVINELDCDTPGIDTQEFIELYGEPNTSLDGYVLVLYNGSSNQSYESFDLDGFGLDENGFFVLGAAATPNVDFVIDDNTIQNGPEAIALYLGDASDFPNNTPLVFENLVDALVYDTNDSDDPELLALLADGQEQVNESANGNQSSEAMARVPNGGDPFITETYVVQDPTPGFTNELICDGGTVAFANTNETSVEVCVDGEGESLPFSFTNTTPDADYFYLLTDENDIIQSFVEEPTYDFAGETPGTCRVYGLSTSGELDASSVEPGQSIEGISADLCASISVNFLTVEKINCIPPNCDAGIITVNGNELNTVICVNGDNTTTAFASNSQIEDDLYFYIIADEVGEIIETIDFEEYDFGGFAPGTCFVYGLSVTGELDESTIQSGEPIGQITSTDCVSLSQGVQVEKVECDDSPGCSDLFFSEYIEGSSQNKALEIYNPTPFVVDLSDYSVQTYNDGSTVPVNSFSLSGTLDPSDVFVISNSNAIPPILNVADATSNVTFYNGNDAIVLRNGGVAIDILGVIGENNGKNMPWEVNNGQGSMAEHTLVRMPEYTEGETDWDIAQMQWEAYGSDNVDFIGDHVTIPCNYPEVPTLSFSTEEINVQEGSMVTVNVNIAFPIQATDVQVVYSGGSAVPDSDFDQVMPVDLSFPEGEFGPQSFTFQIIDDTEEEGLESIVIELQEITEVAFQIASLTVNILPNDFEIPVYDIAEVSGNNPDFVADSLGVVCELRGISHGLNTSTDGIQFTLIDATDGINVFHPENNFDYTVAEGDSLHVIGTIDQFNGLTQIIPDTIIFIDSGFDLEDAPLVSDLNETTESHLARLRCVEVVDPTEWTNEGVGFNVEVSNGMNTHTMRIDGDTDLYGTEAPVGVFSIIGIGGQFDSSEPYDEGYQIQPRYLQDFTTPVNASFEATDQAVEDTPVVFTNTSTGSTEFIWIFGDGSSSVQETDPEHTFTEPGTYTVTLVATSEDGLCDDSFTFEIVIDPVGISETGFEGLQIFPNPVSQQLNVKVASGVDQVYLYDAVGRCVVRQTVNSTQTQIEMQDLSAGSYILVLEREGALHREKIIKE